VRVGPSIRGSRGEHIDKVFLSFGGTRVEVRSKLGDVERLKFSQRAKVAEVYQPSGIQNV
jgi:hypothetical protein